MSDQAGLFQIDTRLQHRPTVSFIISRLGPHCLHNTHFRRFWRHNKRNISWQLRPNRSPLLFLRRRGCRSFPFVCTCFTFTTHLFFSSPVLEWCVGVAVNHQSILLIDLNTEFLFSYKKNNTNFLIPADILYRNQYRPILAQTSRLEFNMKWTQILWTRAAHWCHKLKHDIGAGRQRWNLEAVRSERGHHFRRRAAEWTKIEGDWVPDTRWRTRFWTVHSTPWQPKGRIQCIQNWVMDCVRECGDIKRNRDVFVRGVRVGWAIKMLRNGSTAGGLVEWNVSISLFRVAATSTASPCTCGEDRDEFQTASEVIHRGWSRRLWTMSAFLLSTKRRYTPYPKTPSASSPKSRILANMPIIQ